MAIKKELRLNRKKDIEEIKEKGEFVRTPLFSVLKMEKDELKVGIVVSKKVESRAVDRNKIRRKLSQVIGVNVKKMKGWYLFLAKKELLESKIEEIEKCLEKLF